MRPHFAQVVGDLNLLTCLAEFRPMVIGTPPLGLATEESDIDIACSAKDLERFAAVARHQYGHLEAFSLRRFEESPEPAMIASFRHSGWEVELFCQELDIEDQAGVRHFHVEQRLLKLEPSLQQEILHWKRFGVKTEPAFAKVLQLSGDPYEAMLTLEAKTDKDLRTLIEGALKKEPGRSRVSN